MKLTTSVWLPWQLCDICSDLSDAAHFPPHVSCEGSRPQKSGLHHFWRKWSWKDWDRQDCPLIRFGSVCLFGCGSANCTGSQKTPSGQPGNLKTATYSMPWHWGYGIPGLCVGFNKSEDSSLELNRGFQWLSLAQFNGFQWLSMAFTGEVQWLSMAFNVLLKVLLLETYLQPLSESVPRAKGIDPVPDASGGFHPRSRSKDGCNMPSRSWNLLETQWPWGLPRNAKRSVQWSTLLVVLVKSAQGIFGLCL